MGKTAFVDGNPALGQVGTLVTAAFLNALQNHRHDGLDQDGSAPSTFGVGGGGGNTLTCTLSPPLTAHVVGLPISFFAAYANTGASTLAVDSLSPVALKQADGSSLPGGAIVAGQLITVMYDGTAYRLLTRGRAIDPSISGAFRNLKASAGGSSATITVSADEITVGDSLGYQVLTGVALSVAGTTSGANGLDTGTLAANTWYSLWAIYNPSSRTIAGLMSSSATAPTLPSGYTYKARVGWIRTDGTNKYPLAFVQAGKLIQYKLAAGTNLTAYPVMASGVQGSLSIPTWVAVAWAAFAPPTVSALNISANGAIASSTTAVSPNNAVGAMTSNTNRPALIAGTCQTSYFGYSSSAMIVPESTNIYVAADAAGCSVTCLGWEDNL